MENSGCFFRYTLKFLFNQCLNLKQKLCQARRQ